MFKFLQRKADEYFEAITSFKRGSVVSYLIASLLVFLALIVRLAIAPIETGLPFLTFFPAVTLTVIFGGAGAGFFAIIVSCLLATYFFIQPFLTLSLTTNLESIGSNIVFFLEETLVIFVVETMYRQRENCTATQNLLKELRDAQYELKIAAIAFETQESTIITDSNTVILKVNRAFSIIYGYSAEEAIGKTPSMFKSDLHDDKFYWNMWDKLKRNNFWEGEIWDKRKNGEIFAVWLQISAITAQDGSVSHYVANSSDITAYRKVQQELEDSHESLQILIYERTQELNDRNTEIQAILDTVADGIITMNESGIIQTFNPTAEEIFGYTAAQAIGQNINMLMPEPYHSKHNGYLEQYRATGEKHIIGTGRIVKGLRKDGSIFPLDLAVNEMQLGRGLFFTGIIRDITKRIDTEEQLRFFFDLSLDMLCIAGADGYFKRVNPAFTLNLGWTQEEFLSRPVMDFVHPDDRLATASEITRQFTKGESVLNFENRYLHKNGSWRLFSWASVPHADKLLFATARDITEQKEAEKKIHDLNSTLSLFKSTLDKTLDCILIYDAKTLRFTYVNEGAVQHLGYTISEFSQMSVFDIKKDLTQEAFEQLTLPLIEGSKPSLTYETFHHHKNGHLIPVEAFIQFLHIENQEPCFLSVAHDISMRKETESALVLAKTQAEQANSAKSAFLATMSHEIRTPMNGVIGMVDVLSQSSLKSHQVEMVNTIRESAFSLLGVIEDILDFSKIEANKMEIDNAPTVIAEVTEKVCIMLNPFAIKKNVELTLFCDPKIPTTVLGDSQRLRQIIVNLTNNAIKFSGGQERLGHVSVEAELVERYDKQVLVEIRIIDNGIGMDEKTLSHLFSPFTQADATTTRRFGGSGLGLSIARKLAHLMGGEISVQSCVEQGSTFIVRLPFAVSQDEMVITDKPSLIKGVFCLVISHEPSMSNHLVAYLSHAGAIVISVSDLTAARHFLATQKDSPERIWVWFVDTACISKTEDLRSLHKYNIKIILIQHGRRQRPRWQDQPRTLQLDGNILTSRIIYEATAIAAGRLDICPKTLDFSDGKSTFITPSRSEALRQGRLILVAEDNETNQIVIKHQLALLGFTADIANDGQEALERWRSVDYALLLSDLNMPKMDGYQLTQAIRAEENNTRHISIIALTANALKGELLRCREMGMDDYLGKPTLLVDMKAMLEKWLPKTTELPQLAPEPVATTAEADAELKKPVDVNVLIAQIGNNPLVIHKLLLTFQQEATKTANDLEAAYQAEQPRQVAALAHKLKSAARSVGAIELGELCQVIEEAAKAEQLAEVLPHFLTEVTAVNTYLNTLLALKTM